MEPWPSTENGSIEQSETKAEMVDLPGNTALREFMDRLTDSTNVSKWMDLPTICVMGDTSSGKSSLLSNLSLVELPSSHKMTTRCPIMIHMKRSGTTLARVTVQWRSHETERPDFGERILSENLWEKIPGIILEAQQFVLTHTGKEVAPDVVSLQIQAPNMQDLTLIDLPGTVRSKARDESETLVEDVEALMDEYLRNNRCVILAVVPANVDFHNSQIMADAMQVDPQTIRTIPVITKPDLIDEGAESDVVDLLLGKKMTFSLGFHMVKGRGQAALDRSETLEQGLAEEQCYFDTNDPWKSVTDRSVFGTHRLRAKLGDLQMAMIRQSVPSILREIRQKRDKAATVIEEMGNPHQTIVDRRRYYQDICQTLVAQLKASLSGKGRGVKKPSGAAALHEACSEFMNHIRQGSLGTIRTVVEGANVLVTSSRGSVRGQVVHLDETFACVDYVDDEDIHSEALFECVGLLSQDAVEKDDVWSDGSKVFIARNNNFFDTLRKIPLSSVRTDPSWLKEKIAENRTDDLACFLNVDIFRNIVEDFIEEDWKPRCTSLLERTREILMSTVVESIQRSVTPNRYPSLRSLIERLSRHAADELLEQGHSQLQSHLKTEKHPYTQDHVLFQSIAEARHRSLKRELEVSLRLDQEGVYDTQAIKTIMDGVFERCQQKSVEDHMAEEMEIVLESYGQVATKRVVDRTPMICWEIFRSLADVIQEALWSTTDDMLLQCTQDSPGFLQKYQAMSRELEEMNKALEIFKTIL